MAKRTERGPERDGQEEQRSARVSMGGKAGKMSDAQTQELYELFKLVDADSSGSIDVDEVLMLMRMLSMSADEHEAASIVSEVDADGNGLIEYVLVSNSISYQCYALHCSNNLFALRLCLCTQFSCAYSSLLMWVSASVNTCSFNELQEAISGESGIEQSRKNMMRAFRLFQDKDAPFGFVRQATLENALGKHCNSSHYHGELLDRIVKQSERCEGGWIKYTEIVEALIGSDGIQDEQMT